MNIYHVRHGSILPLGKQGENLARKIQFDISRWIGSFGPGTVQLLHQRSGDETPYPVAVEQEGNLAVWTVTSADTAAAGTGRAELQYYVGDALAKSETWMTKVLAALGPASETPPEAQQGWVDQVLQAGAAATEAADRSENAAVRQPIVGSNGNWWTWDLDAGAYADTGIYSGGDAPYIGANGNWYVGQTDTGVAATGPAGPTGETGPVGPVGPTGHQGPPGPALAVTNAAAVGQTVRITAVNDEGQPTEWEAVDMPEQVQPDWNQNDSTAADYVKNRPFYTGDTVVETVLVEESTVTFVKNNDLYSAELPPTFEATVGETYKVSWDGTVYECTSALAEEGAFSFGNSSIVGEGSDTGEPFIIVVLNGRAILILTQDTSSSHTVSISRIGDSVVKLDEKYLPENVATKSAVEAAQTTADNAQTTADNAQTTADNAQTTADNAQTTADKNKETLSELFASVFTFTFDKQTSGGNTFVFNGFNYYKISDFNPAPEDVISFTGTRENGTQYSTITAGNNCTEYGLFIIVASAGVCSLTVGPTTFRFTAPSAGLYARYQKGNTIVTAGTGQFTVMTIDGLTIKSSTYGSNKKFRITVDDSGTLSTTEVT